MGRLVSVIKTVWLKLRYGNAIRMKGIIGFSPNTTVTIVGGEIEFGERVRTSRNVHLSAVKGKLLLGDRVFLIRNCIAVCRETIKIGDGCSFGPNVMLYDHDHRFDESGVKQTEYKTGEIVIGDNCWIGAGAVILRNTHIGEGCVIGAGAVVKGDIPSHTLVVAKRELCLRPIENII